MQFSYRALVFALSMALAPALLAETAKQLESAQSDTSPEAPSAARLYQGPGGASDNFESINRSLWWFNYDIMDRKAVRPVVHWYADTVPEPLRDGVANFANNFEEPNNFVNNLLIWDLRGSFGSVFRFMVNTTVGLGGFIDVASRLGVERNPMEMTTVLGKWSIDQGPYIMFPVYGPSTVRGTVGDVVDGLYFPFSEMTFVMKATRWGLDGLSVRSQVIAQEPMLDNSLDPYANIRDFFLQYEEAKVQGQAGPQGLLPAESAEPGLDDYLDEIDQ